MNLNYRIFVKMVSEPVNLQEKNFTEHQGGALKPVERVFVVFFGSFYSMSQPSRLWLVSDMNAVLNGCCIIHNMIVYARRTTSTGTSNIRFKMEETVPLKVCFVTSPEVTYHQASLWRWYVHGIKNSDCSVHTFASIGSSSRSTSNLSCSRWAPC